jgi:hypothetical protein
VNNEAEQLDDVSYDGCAIEHIKNPSEVVQLAAVKQTGLAMYHIIKKGIVPSEAVQLAAVNQSLWALSFIKSPSQVVIKAALTNPLFIDDQTYYENAVGVLFADNALLMKKWLRYGEAMRNHS